jgi:hypothetical protein
MILTSLSYTGLHLVAIEIMVIVLIAHNIVDLMSIKK